MIVELELFIAIIIAMKEKHKEIWGGNIYIM